MTGREVCPWSAERMDVVTQMYRVFTVVPGDPSRAILLSTARQGTFDRLLPCGNLTIVGHCKTCADSPWASRLKRYGRCRTSNCLRRTTTFVASTLRRSLRATRSAPGWNG